MNIFKAIFFSGLSSWWSDKKSIRQRFIYWPIAVPVIMLSFIALALFTLSARSGEGGELSQKGGVSVALEVTPVSKSIAKVLSSSPTNYEIIFAEKNDLVRLVESNEATFYISVANTDGKLVLSLGYDSQRNYPHKNWIDGTRERLHEIVNTIQIERLESLKVSKNILEESDVALSLRLNSFGEGGGNFLLIALGYILWSVIFINALDAARSQFYSGFIADVTNDLLPIWLTARASHHRIMQSRLAVGACIYMVGMTIFLAYCILFGILYGMFAEFMVANLGQEILSDPKLQPMTVGYLNVIGNIGLPQILGAWVTFLMVGVFALSALLHSAINSITTEQGRTKGKVLEIAFNLIPMIGILIGYAANSSLVYVPFIGLYQILMELIAGDATLSTFATVIAIQASYVAILILFFGTRMNGRKRFMKLSANNA